MASLLGRSSHQRHWCSISSLFTGRDAIASCDRIVVIARCSMGIGDWLCRDWHSQVPSTTGEAGSLVQHEHAGYGRFSAVDLCRVAAGATGSVALWRSVNCHRRHLCFAGLTQLGLKALRFTQPANLNAFKRLHNLPLAQIYQFSRRDRTVFSNDGRNQIGWRDIKGGIEELGSGWAENCLTDLINL